MNLPLLTYITYNPLEATSTGYDISFYPDYAILEYHSRWQGSYTGQTWKAVPPEDVTAALHRELADEDHGHEPDLAAAIEAWLGELSFEDRASNCKLIRRGSLIQ